MSVCHSLIFLPMHQLHTVLLLSIVFSLSGFGFGALIEPELLVRLSTYDCYDLYATSTASNIAKMTPSYGIIFPRSEQQLKLSFWLNFQDGTLGVKRRLLRISCSKRQDLDVYAFSGAYNGEIVTAQGTVMTINTVPYYPVVQGKVSSTDALKRVLDASLAILDNFSLEIGPYLATMEFHVLSTNMFDCSILGTRGCIKIEDYSPSLRTEQTALECQNFPDDNAVALENCGPPLTVTRAEETSEMVEESVSISRTATTTLTIGKTFTVNKGVRSSRAVNTGSQTKETQKGVTEEESKSESSLSSTSLSVRSVNREYTIPFGRSLIEERNTEVCTGRGLARGCLDSQCTLALKLDYLYTTTTITNKFQMEYLPCTEVK